MGVTNALISAARTAWYAATEPLMLRWSRIQQGCLDALSLTLDMPMVSVYIPTHNRVDLLMSRCLPSVLAQSYANIEVIVIADNCTDDTARRVLELAGIDRRVRLVEHRGPKSFPHKAENYWFAGRVDPANVGLAHCRGEWIATNDDDDIWTSDHILTLMLLAVAEDHEFVSAAHATQYGKAEPYNVNGALVGGIQTWMYRSYLKSFRFNRQCWRKSWNRVCDTDMQDRFRRAGVRMGYVDHVVTHVLPRPGEEETGLSAYVRDREATERHFAL